MIYDSLLIILKENSKNKNANQVTYTTHMSIDASCAEKKPIIHYLITQHYFH